MYGNGLRQLMSGRRTCCRCHRRRNRSGVHHGCNPCDQRGQRYCAVINALIGSIHYWKTSRCSSSRGDEIECHSRRECCCVTCTVKCRINVSVPTDVTSQESIQNLIKIISKDHSSVDILFANGNWSPERKAEMQPGSFRKTRRTQPQAYPSNKHMKHFPRDPNNYGMTPSKRMCRVSISPSSHSCRF
jgi:hypothetical protein